MGSQVRWTYDQNRSSSGLPGEGFSLNLTLDVTRTPASGFYRLRQEPGASAPRRMNNPE